MPNGDKVHEGQSLLLQVRSIGSKDKVHLFTNNIILTGKFINLLPYGDEIILSRRTRKNLDTNQQDKIMDALSESEVGLIARHNLVPENLDIAQAELQSLNQQWKDIELNAKELNEEGLVFKILILIKILFVIIQIKILTRLFLVITIVLKKLKLGMKDLTLVLPISAKRCLLNKLKNTLI